MIRSSRYGEVAGRSPDGGSPQRTALAARPPPCSAWSPPRAGESATTKGPGRRSAPALFLTLYGVTWSRRARPGRRLRGGDDVAGGRALVDDVRARIADRGADARVRAIGTGILHQAIFRLAARRLTAEQRVQRLLLAAARLDGRGAGLRRDQREVGGSPARAGARRQVVGTRPVQATTGPTSRQQRGAGQTCDDGHQLTHCSSPRERAGRAREARAPAEPERLS